MFFFSFFGGGGGRWKGRSSACIDTIRAFVQCMIKALRASLTFVAGF